jgi:hypothetical protein
MIPFLRSSFLVTAIMLVGLSPCLQEYISQSPQDEQENAPRKAELSVETPDATAFMILCGAIG